MSDELILRLADRARTFAQFAAIALFIAAVAVWAGVLTKSF